MTVRDLLESLTNLSPLTQVSIRPLHIGMEPESGTYRELSDAAKNAEIEFVYLGDFDKDHDLLSIDIDVI